MAAPQAPGILIFPNPLHACPIAHGFRAAVADRDFPLRICYAARPGDPSLELLQMPAPPCAPMTARAKSETLQWLSLCEMAG
jgi:hypothetical protein